MTPAAPLPPGQHERSDFPRFGMTKFAGRFPKDVERRRLALGGDALFAAVVLDDCTAGLPHRLRTADFHCVTTWSFLRIEWGGVAFADFYEAHVVPRLRHLDHPPVAQMRGQDGWRTTLPVSDLLSADVLLATHAGGEPLSIAHGAPLRLVAPAHYGYKSVKHLQALDILRYEPRISSLMGRILDHPRARVAEEERVRWLPGRFFRGLGRSLIDPTVEHFREAQQGAAGGSRSSGVQPSPDGPTA